ncbi:TnsA endonuclease N-terminal domain-containing protein [Yoonia sp. 2307UL14-13]|uniref:TnsA endonuclease N-terminal domain-containing protein n=1 Tax=Yoonia sp. 2307UL14-13 TaxID=3126506 RepID=UPI0030A6EB25
MQLRDRKSGNLIDPLPPLQHFAKAERQSMMPDLARKTRPPKAKKTTSKAAKEQIPDFEFNPDDDPISLIWEAVQHDIQHVVSPHGHDEAMRMRNQDIALKRFDPGSALQAAVRLEDLSQTYGITRERVRQIQEKAERMLATRSTTRPRACQQVLATLVARYADDEDDSAQIWLVRLLLEAHVSHDFGCLVLRVAGTVLGLPSEQSKLLRGRYAEAVVQLPRARKRHERTHEVALKRDQRISRADALVLGVLKQATFGGHTAASQIPVNADLPALRSCKGEREIFVSCLQRMIAFESDGERRLIRALDQCTIVDQFVAQALEIPYADPEYGARSYFPDLLLKTTEGLVFVVEIKARPMLADREVQLKADAATDYLGKRGVGYCLVDRNGDGCDEIRKVAVADTLKSVIRDKLREKGTFRFKDLKAHLGPWPNDADVDEVQSLALAHDLDYRAQLWPSETSKFGTRLDFALRLGPFTKRSTKEVQHGAD